MLEDYYKRKRDEADPELYERTLPHAIPRVRFKKKLGQVGYGKPPKANQFKPGQSGNPKGRPKGTVSVRQQYEKMLTAKVDVRQGDEIFRMSRIEALLMANLNNAFKGNQRAINIVLGVIKELGLMDKRPQKAAFGNLESLTIEELEEFERLIEKSEMRVEPA